MGPPLTTKIKKDYERPQNPHMPPQNIFIKKYYERLENSHMRVYNTKVYFTFWKLVKTNQGYEVRKNIDIYKEMSVIYK
jgi:hypothetical protein